MVLDTPWEVEPNSKGRAWRHTQKSDCVIHLMDMENEDERERLGHIESDGRWILTGFNSTIPVDIDDDCTEKEAKEIAREWLRDNQNPSSMIS